LRAYQPGQAFAIPTFSELPAALLNTTPAWILKPIRFDEIARDARALVAFQGAFEDDYFGHFPVEMLRGFSGETAQLENTSITRVR